jgi:hypothetical protein
LTQSAGSQTINATGDKSDEANREIFVFNNKDDGWKIARYNVNKAA